MKQRKQYNRIAILLVVAVMLAGVGLATYKIATNLTFDQTAARGTATLRLTVSGLKGALDQYRSLPRLIAEKKDIQAFLNSAVSPNLVDNINAELKRLKTIVKASAIYVMNSDGLTVAASNFDLEKSFIGKNFSYRPYFQQAINGHQGRFFAIGTTSLKRGYYFSSPVIKNANIIGVVAVKVSIDQMEQAWSSRDYEILVTDEQGIIFMSSQKAWRFKSIRPLSASSLQEIRKTRKYEHADLRELKWHILPENNNGYKLAMVSETGKPKEYLVQTGHMADQGWNVHIFSATGPARNQAYIITTAIMLVMLSIFLATGFFNQRRKRLHERMKTQNEAARQLEYKVSLRTRDLDQANIRLTAEVAERKAAETELRKTQKDLIQAGKLAALGQMSAALSHELNQPLGATKSYADNAATYLELGRLEEAGRNIKSISSLVDRMATISRHLRNFARKPGEKLHNIPVQAVINDAIAILQSRIRSKGVIIETDMPESTIEVVGGHVRLQQVLVNLVNNALDAMEHSKTPRLIIAVESSDGKVIISITDFGPGLSKASEEQLFDPFFTTKGVSRGLGLGLSISYNIIRDFGGELHAANHDAGGAVFTVTLKQATASAMEAP